MEIWISRWIRNHSTGCDGIDLWFFLEPGISLLLMFEIINVRIHAAFLQKDSALLQASRHLAGHADPENGTGWLISRR
ncbi:uncharacterized protein Dmul_39110 [Desulfococcus multivorans]|nr:uncharacterized protein Dmul_39110 [Desulfococcus multivorans]